MVNRRDKLTKQKEKRKVNIKKNLKIFQHSIVPIRSACCRKTGKPSR